MSEILFSGEWVDVASAWVANQILVRGTLILILALVATRLLRGVTASARYVIWLLALAALVVGPVLSFAGSMARPDAVTASSTAASGSISAERAASPAVPSARADLGDSRLGARGLTGPSGAFGAPVVPSWLFWLWLAGSGVLLSRLIVHAWAASRLPAGARKPDGVTQSVFEETRREVCPGVAARLRVRPDIRVPIVVGGRRPVVVVPPFATTWPADRLRSTFRHELAHVVRQDYPLHLATGAVLALYWATPLAWLARRLLDLERESACDERVIAWGTGPAEYAQHLLDVARAAGRSRFRTAHAFAGRGHGLAHRVRGILASRRARRLSVVGWTIAVVLAVVGTTMISTIEPVQTRREARRDAALAGLTDTDPGVRRHAAWMLGELEAATDVAPLQRALFDPSPQVRAVAAWALGEIKDPATGPALARLLNDGDPRVREIAALSIGEIGDPSGVDALIDARSRDSALDGPVRWALVEIGGPGLLRQHGTASIAAALPDPDLWAGHFDPDAEPLNATVLDLIDRLASDQAATRAASAVALGRANDERAVDPLLDALRDPAPDVRAAAVWALDEINPSR